MARTTFISGGDATVRESSSGQMASDSTLLNRASQGEISSSIKARKDIWSWPEEGHGRCLDGSAPNLMVR